MLPTARFRNLRLTGRRALRSLRSSLKTACPPTGAARDRLTPIEGLENRVLMAAGAVFVATNHNNTEDPAGPANEVVMYDREADGTLVVAGRFETGGQGSGPSVRFAGDGLGSAHSVQLSKDKKFLFVANAGSDTVSVFRVTPGGLTLTDVEPTGDFPNSVAQHGNRVYVLNANGDASITGYRLSTNGTLKPLSNSTRTLDANQDPIRSDVLFNPTQVSFTPDGRKLVVTIKDGPAAGAIPGADPTGPGRVLVFGLDSERRPARNFVQTNLNNEGPFGFSFDNNGNLITTLFVGGPNLSSAVGSFRINSNNTLTPITRNLPNTQLDSCWIENNGTYAYSANYGSATISSYRIGADGSLTLLEAVAGTADDLPRTTDDPAGDTGKTQGATPLDIRVSPNGQFVYNVLPASGAVAGWRINADGTLTKVGEFGGLPDTVEGDVAPQEFGAGGSPAGIEMVDYAQDTTPARNVLYVMTNDPRRGKNAILAYRRNPQTGELTRLGEYRTGGTGYQNVDDRIGPDDSDQEIVVDRAQRWLFAVNQGSHTVSVFDIQADGSLRLKRGGPFASGGRQPVSIGISKGKIIVTNKGDQNPDGTGGTSRPNYTTFRVRGNGTLERIRDATITIGAGDSPTQSLVTRDLKFMIGDNFLARPIPELAPFVPAFGSELESFSIGANGTLTRVMAPLPSPLPGLPDQYILGMQTHPTENILYTGFVVSNKLGVFTYDDKGVLTFVKAINLTGAGICWIVASKDGKRLYATNFSTSSVAVIDTSDPLNPVEIQEFKLKGPDRPQRAASPAMFETVSFQVSLDPTGERLYVLNHEQALDDTFPEGNRVHVMRVGDDGRLTEEDSSPLILPQEFVPAFAHPQGILAL